MLRAQLVYIAVRLMTAAKAGDEHLGIDGLEEGFLPKVLLSPHQGLPDGRLATASRTKKENRPAHDKDFTQLTDLQAESLIRLVTQLQSCLLDLQDRNCNSCARCSLPCSSNQADQ